MSVALPIIRDNRRRDLAAGVGQTVFTFDAPVTETDDITVATRTAPSTLFVSVTSGFSVALLAGNVGATVTFAAPPRPTADAPVTTVRLDGARVHARTTDVTRGGAIRAAALERELDLQATVLQELRRDVDLIDLAAAEKGAVDAAAAAALSADLAAAEVVTAQNAAAASSASAVTAAVSEASARSLVAEARAGFTGFSANTGYDFGMVSDPITYFNQNWGGLLS